MPSGNVRVSVPEGFEETVSTTAGELEDQVRLMAALKMFELGKLSSGRTPGVLPPRRALPRVAQGAHFVRGARSRMLSGTDPCRIL